MIPCFNVSILILTSNLRRGVSGRLFHLGFGLVQAIHQDSDNSEAAHGRVLKRTIARRMGKSQENG
jgi:hypothetical protein